MTARLLLAAAALALAAPLVLGGPDGAATPTPSLTTEARAVASELFRSINERRYERSCELLVDGVHDPDLCVTGLRIGFTWSQEIAFRITGATVAGRTATVRALADGRPGRVVLVRQANRWRVLRLEGP